jgi:hypothetical protein
MVKCDYLQLVLDQSFNHIQNFHTFREVGIQVEHILGKPSFLEDIVQLAVASFALFARIFLQKDIFQLIACVNYQQIVEVDFGINIVGLLGF